MTFKCTGSLFFIHVFLGCIFLIISSSSFAKEPVRTEDSVIVEAGLVGTTGILSDDKGYLFIEFLKNTRVTNTVNHALFEGEILPPEIIDMPTEKAPRGRMREFMTFELLTDTSDVISFVDKYNLIHPKNVTREIIKGDDADLHRSGGVRIFTTIYEEDEIGTPSLWQFIQQDEENPERGKWKKLGGKLEETTEDGVSVFTSTIAETGIYTIFDVNPYPEFSPTFPIDQVELVEQSPYPSVVQEESTLEDPVFIPAKNANAQAPVSNNSYQESSSAVIPATQPINNTQNQENFIPAVENTGFKSSAQNAQTSTINQNAAAPNNETTLSTVGTQLPKTGADEPPVTPKQSFPFILILAIGLLGTSAFMAFRGRAF